MRLKKPQLLSPRIIVHALIAGEERNVQVQRASHLQRQRTFPRMQSSTTERSKSLPHIYRCLLEFEDE